MDFFTQNIWTVIYSFDDTYYQYFTVKVLPYIHEYKTYKINNSRFLIIDKKEASCLLMDNLKKPTYISTTYFIEESYLNKFCLPKLEIINISIESIEKLKCYDFCKKEIL
jgi:hypothetical protein